jgi:hypothetical protein
MITNDPGSVARRWSREQLVLHNGTGIQDWFVPPEETGQFQAKRPHASLKTDEFLCIILGLRGIRPSLGEGWGSDGSRPLGQGDV